MNLVNVNNGTIINNGIMEVNGEYTNDLGSTLWSPLSSVLVIQGNNIAIPFESDTNSKEVTDPNQPTKYNNLINDRRRN